MRAASTPCRRALAAASALLAAACVGPPSPDAPRAIPLQAQGDYRHGLTGLGFPMQIGPYLRTELAAYDADARNVAGRYALRGDPSAIAIVQLYPATHDASYPSWDDLDAEFESVRNGIEPLREGGELLSDFEGDALVNGFSLRGRQAVYRVEVGAKEPVVSSLHLYAIENWYLKLHFEHAERLTSEAAWRERELIASIRWPLPGDRPRTEPTPACVELANRYEAIARLQDRGLSREEQIAAVAEEVGDAEEDRGLRTTSMNAIAVSEAHPTRTSFQIRKLVLDDCVEHGEGRAVLETLGPGASPREAD